MLVEKPMGLSPADTQAILDTCREYGVACGVPFIVRYTAAYAEARRLVQARAIGEVTGFRIVYRGDKPNSYWRGGYSGRAQSDWRQGWATAGGGVLLMNTIHDLDSVLWLTGLQVTEVDGLIDTKGSPAEVEDVALAIRLTRFVALDLHKDYILVGAVDAHQHVVLPSRRIAAAAFEPWARMELTATNAVVLEATTTAWQIHDLLVPSVTV